MNQQVRNELQSLSQMANQLKNDEQQNAQTLQGLIQAEEKAQQDLNRLQQRLQQLSQDLQMGTGGGSMNQMLQPETSPNLINTTTPAGGYQGDAYQPYTGGTGSTVQHGYYGDAYQPYTGHKYSNQKGTRNTGQ